MSEKQPGIFTKEEILSQPEVWKKTLDHLRKMPQDGYPGLRGYDQVIFSGCGSTFYLARWAARTAEAAQGVICRAVPASDLLLFPETWLQKRRKTLLVTISRSGETTETVKALERFQATGYGDAIVITCYPQNQLAQRTPYVIATPDAQERSVAQTRSFTNMLLAVNWLIHRNISEDFPLIFSRVGNQLNNQYLKMAQMIGQDKSISRLFFLGSGALYGLANEAMLKMKEMSLTYSEAYHFLEFRHGPMSMVDQHSLVIGLISASASTQEMALLAEMKTKGARLLGLMDEDKQGQRDILDDCVVFNSALPETWRAPFYLPVLQFIAYERAMVKGLNPDHPTNISSVVVLNDTFN